MVFARQKPILHRHEPHIELTWTRSKPVMMENIENIMGIVLPLVCQMCSPSLYSYIVNSSDGLSHVLISIDYFLSLSGDSIHLPVIT